MSNEREIRQSAEYDKVLRDFLDKIVGEQKKEGYAASDKRAADKWMESLASTATGDEFLDAVMALHERNDIAPLLAFVRSGRPLSSANRDNLARLLELLFARGRPLKNGRPGGKHLRWQNSNYVAAFQVDQFMAAWRREHGKKRVPDKQRDKFVDAVIGQMKEAGKRRPNKKRVLELLHEPKDRRL
jgi:hypothetical protein